LIVNVGARLFGELDNVPARIETFGVGQRGYRVSRLPCDYLTQLNGGNGWVIVWSSLKVCSANNLFAMPQNLVMRIGKAKKAIDG
jgi:hypothetical protein